MQENMHKLGPTGFRRTSDFGNNDESQQIGNLSKKGGKNQELIQSSTTPDQGYHMGK